MTKPATSVAAMMLVEQGRLSLDAEASRYSRSQRRGAREQHEVQEQPTARFAPDGREASAGQF